VCGGELFTKGLRKRKLILSGEEKITLMIRRLQCEHCGRIHHELPDILVPYKRHCSATIEAVIGGGDQVAVETRTNQRIAEWWRKVGTYFLRVMKSLFVKYEIPPVEKPAFGEVVRAAVNSGNWIFAAEL
jgi:hypothetical protein